MGNVLGKRKRMAIDPFRPSNWTSSAWMAILLLGTSVAAYSDRGWRRRSISDLCRRARLWMHPSMRRRTKRGDGLDAARRAGSAERCPSVGLPAHGCRRLGRPLHHHLLDSRLHRRGILRRRLRDSRLHPFLRAYRRCCAEPRRTGSRLGITVRKVFVASLCGRRPAWGTSYAKLFYGTANVCEVL